MPAAFAHQCDRAPDAIAVSGPAGQTSYRSLAAAAQRVAAGLSAAGVRAGDRVALRLPRGADYIAAMLGILHLGAAFVPLDPADPPARLAAILSDCHPACIIAESASASDPPVLPIAALLAAPGPTAGSPEDPAEQPAYIMYTSGSTGAPKGVVVPHRAILRLVLHADYADLSPDTVMLHLAPLAFDASTFEIWGALLNGGRLAVVAAERPSLDDIVHCLTTQRANTAWLTAGLFHLLADCRMAAFAGLRQLLAGGDVLSPSHAAAVLRAHPDLRLINGYGPTENTTFTCCHRITLADCAAGALPIGRPIHGTTVALLDEALEPVPQGQPGQLCAGGQGVALRYLNQPGLTAARFIADPDASHPGDRRYLTGDRAIQRPDGSFAFLGREDRQVKINGHRIELDEVEHALRACASVQDAAVVALADARAVKRLVAYVTPMTAIGDPTTSLRAALAGSLPDWALPSVIVPLSALPLTANGKIDRARLPPPPIAAASPPPVTQIEAQLGAVIAAVLGLATVGRDDNFFDLGATSLQLIEVHARLAATLWPRLALLTLFEAPCLRQLAARVAPAAPATPAGQTAAARAQAAADALSRARLARAARA